MKIDKGDIAGFILGVATSILANWMWDMYRNRQHKLEYSDKKIIEEMQMRTKEEFYITNIKREKYSYVLTNDEDGGYFFNAVVSYSSLDDDGENQKKVTMNMCVETSHIDKVSEIVSKVLEGSVEFTLKKVIETKIIYVIQ